MYYWGLICCFLSFCWACTDDSEDVNSTDLDIDWFVVEDSENPIDHLIYTVYEKYGVPIYYDDTIGKRDRGEYNMSGEKIIFYKVLQPEYTISSHTSTFPSLSDCHVKKLQPPLFFNHSTITLR